MNLCKPSKPYYQCVGLVPGCLSMYRSMRVLEPHDLCVTVQSQLFIHDLALFFNNVGGAANYPTTHAKIPNTLWCDPQIPIIEYITKVV